MIRRQGFWCHIWPQIIQSWSLYKLYNAQAVNHIKIMDNLYMDWINHIYILFSAFKLQSQIREKLKSELGVLGALLRSGWKGVSWWTIPTTVVTPCTTDYPIQPKTHVGHLDGMWNMMDLVIGWLFDREQNLAKILSHTKASWTRLIGCIWMTELTF